MLTLSPSLVVTVELAGAGYGTMVFGQADDVLALQLLPIAQGAPGPSGGERTVVASEALGGHRAVTVDGRHAESASANILAGITTSAVAVGGSVVVVSAGRISESSWSWAPDAPIFLGPAGTLTQTPPSSGLIRRVAWAITPTQINVDFMPPILVG